MSLDDLFDAAVVAELDLPRPRVVSSGTSVREAVSAMRETSTSAAIVLDSGRLVGLFTEVDYVRDVLGRDIDPEAPVDEFMTRAPTTVTRDERLSQCLKLMSAGDFRHLPVVDGQGIPTHLLAVRHLMQYLAERYPSEVLAMAPNVFQITEVDGG